MLTPDELKGKVFKKDLFGYNPGEVDEFISKITKEFEYLYMDNMNMKDSIERISSKLEYYQRMETTLQSTLTMAQDAADEVRENSMRRASAMETESQAKSQKIIMAAQEEAQRLVDEASQKASELYGQIKVRSDSLRKATEVECKKMRDDTDTYVNNLRNTVERETNDLKTSTEKACKQTSENTVAESRKILEDARNEAHDMLLEANNNYRKIMADAEERSRKMIYEAETKVVDAKNDYNNLVKKTEIFKKNIFSMLEAQMGVMKNCQTALAACNSEESAKQK